MESKTIIKKNFITLITRKALFLSFLVILIVFAVAGPQDKSFAQGKEYLRLRQGTQASEDSRYTGGRQQGYVAPRPASNEIGYYSEDKTTSKARMASPLYSTEQQQQPIKEYRVAIGDSLEVYVWQNADLTKIVNIGPDGTISYPLVGRIHAAGLTLVQLEEKFTSELAKFIKSPQVAIMVQQFSETKPNRVIVLGAVGAPGVYSYKGSISLLEALAQAGDFREDAKDDTVIIVRGNFTKNPQVIKVNARSIIRKGTSRKEIIMQSNDVIYVPRTFEKKRVDKIMVLGQVNYPGIYSYSTNLTLLEVISLAGDFNDQARSDSVMVMRGNMKEKPEISRINVRSMVLRGELQNNIVLKPNDVIYVPRSFISDFNKFFENIKSVVDDALYILDVRQQIRFLQGYKK